ncbi:hypothetical protein GV51_0920 [Gardnerella vaginalis 5-1]|nr:hypothetical protein GV51_0920 [Gardnerella vaginalis 5-1]
MLILQNSCKHTQADESKSLITCSRVKYFIWQIPHRLYWRFGDKEFMRLLSLVISSK